MKTTGKQYSTLRQFLGICAEKDSPVESYRLGAWLRIFLGYPFIIIPAWLSIDFFMQLSTNPELALVFVDIWAMAHVGLLISSILAFLASFNTSRPFSLTVLKHATLVCGMLEIVTALMVSFMIGVSQATPHLFVFMLIN